MIKRYLEYHISQDTCAWTIWPPFIHECMSLQLTKKLKNQTWLKKITGYEHRQHTMTILPDISTIRMCLSVSLVTRSLMASAATWASLSGRLPLAPSMTFSLVFSFSHKSLEIVITDWRWCSEPNTCICWFAKSKKKYVILFQCHLRVALTISLNLSSPSWSDLDLWLKKTITRVIPAS